MDTEMIWDDSENEPPYSQDECDEWDDWFYYGPDVVDVEGTVWLYRARNGHLCLVEKVMYYYDDGSQSLRETRYTLGGVLPSAKQKLINISRALPCDCWMEVDEHFIESLIADIIMDPTSADDGIPF
ncbi:MAG: hypothetical protein L6Q98_25210 [Anaerolineae bacterium]|nr:hypothetical protein [Anaerolineae bacterium]NUQ07375.1 hypothetical protein [Anaerolineae bacterium]